MLYLRKYGKKITLIFFVLLLLNLNPVFGAVDWVLKYNFTFNTGTISDYNQSSPGDYTIDTTNCKNGKCLRRVDAGSSYSWVWNDSIAINSYEQPLKMIYWSLDQTQSDHSYGGVGIVNGSSEIWCGTGRYWASSGYHRSGCAKDASLDYPQVEDGYNYNYWVKVQVNVWNDTERVVIYDIDNTTVLQNTTSTKTWIKAGNLIYSGSTRPTIVDDLEVWYLEETGGSPPATGDTPVVNIPSYTFSITTNLTNGNYTDNPLNWSVSVTNNYNITVPDYFARWSFNQTGNLTEDRLIHNLTASGAVQEANSKFGYGYHFDGANDYLNTSFYGGNSWGDGAITVTAWINASELNTDQTMIAHSDTSMIDSDGGWQFYISSTGNVLVFHVGGVSADEDYRTSSDAITKDTWTFISATYELGKCPVVYINGINNSDTCVNDGVTNFNASYPLSIGANSQPALYFNGSIDEVRIYNRSLSSNEIYELYTKTQPNFDCTLYANTSSVGTYNNLLQGQTKNIGWDTTNIEAGYIQNITCTDYFKENSDQADDVFVDTVKPDNTLTGGNLANNTVYYYDLITPNLMNVSVTCDDPNLYSCNVTVWQLNSTGQRIYQWNNTVIINSNATAEKINTTLNIEMLNISRYEIFAETADSHTANKVKPMQWFYTDDAIHIEGIELTGDIKPELTEFILSETEDKYKFKITWNEDALVHTIDLSAVGDLAFRPDDGYKGHFVYWPQRRWIDFEGKNIKDVTATPLGNNQYRLEIEHYTMTDEAEFESIGDLNVLQSSWFFNVSQGFTVDAVDTITNTSISNFTLYLYSGTTLLQNKSTTDGNITFNLTSGSYDINITSSDYVSNRTEGIAPTAGGTYTFHLTALNSLYLLVFDEQTDAYIDDRTVTIDVINFDNSSNTYTTTTGTKFISGFAAGSYEINYYAENYTERSYYTTITGGDTQTIRLYLLKTAEGDYKNFDLVDESASPLSNATVKMQRYFIDGASSTWRTVEMAKTNDAGEGFFFAELYDTNYRFVIEYLGATVKTTQQTKFDTRDLYLKVSLTSSGLQSYFELGDATTSLSFNNETDVWTFDYNSPSSAITQANLLVIKRDGWGETIISNTTGTGDSGAVTYNQSSYNGDDGTFYAFGYLTTTVDSVAHLVEVASASYAKAHEYFGLNGVLMAMLIIGTLAGIGVWAPSAAIIMSLFGLIITVAMGLMALSWVWLIGAIIVGVIFVVKLRA